METVTEGKSSLLSLFRTLTGDTKALLRQEVQLAKTELSEKLSRMGRNAAALAVGGIIAFAGLIVLLIGLGWLVGYALESAGLNQLLAGSLGILAIAVVVMAIGLILLLQGKKKLAQESLTPDRTLHTLQELRGREHAIAQTAPEPEHKPSSEEMQARVEATEERMGETLDELGRRLSPSHINAQVRQKISAKPYQSGLIAMAVGFVGALVLRKRSQRA